MDNSNSTKIPVDGLLSDISRIPQLLKDASHQITSEMVLKAPIKTGRLKNSIKAEAFNYGVEIRFLEYGAYQNWGVSGTKDRVGLPNPFGYTYEFKDRRFGIKPNKFFDVDKTMNIILEKLKTIGNESKG